MGFIRNKKDAIAAIKRREKTVNGKVYATYDCYLGMDPVTGKPKRIWDTDRKRLEEKVSEFYSSAKTNGLAAIVLTPDQVFDAKTAYVMLAEKGLNRSLRDIVAFYLDSVRQREEASVAKEITAEAALKEYMETFSSIQTAQADTVTRTVGRWVKSLPAGTLVSSVSYDSVMKYLNSHGNWAPKSWNNAMLYIKTFLAWCASPLRGYAKENPLALAKRKVIAWHEPEYMRFEEVERLVRLVERRKDERPDMLVFFTLWFFCGMRVAEIERMANDAEAVRISIEDETVRVAKPKGYQKGIRPRSFHMEDNALAWLKSVDIRRGISMLCTKTRRGISEIAADNGITIPDNAGRHTFITYHVAAYGEPSKTEGMVGTSANMRCTNYMGLESKRNGQGFFAIFPS